MSLQRSPAELHIVQPPQLGRLRAWCVQPVKQRLSCRMALAAHELNRQAEPACTSERLQHAEHLLSMLHARCVCCIRR